MQTDSYISGAIDAFLESLDDGPAILIGTGRLGKSNTLDERNEIRLIDSLPELQEFSEGADLGSSEYPVIDSLYRVIVEYHQTDSTEYKNTFETIVDTGCTEDGISVGAVMRPWSFQYVCGDSESRIGSLLTDWDRHYATIGKTDAIEIGVQITDLNQDTVAEYISETYFEFDIPTDTTDYSYETYIPHLLLDLTHDADDYLPPGAICSSSGSISEKTAGGLRDFGEDLFKQASFSKIQTKCQQVIKKVKSLDQDVLQEHLSELDRDSFPDDVIEYVSNLDTEEITDPVLKTLGTAVPGAYPVLLLVLYYTSQEDGQIVAFEEFKNQSKLLFGDSVPTPTKELLEANLDLEPYTLESANKLASEETVAKIRLLQNSLQNVRDTQRTLSDELSSFKTDLASLEDEFTSFETDLQQLRDRFDEMDTYLSTNTVSHPEIVDEKFELSLLDTNQLTERLLQQEIRYLKPSNGLSLSLEDLPRDRTAERNTIAALEDNQIVIIRGAIGTGKTTTAYHTLAGLERSGVFVGLPNFEKSDYAYIRHALQRIENRPRYLFVSYRLGFPVVDTPTQLRNLLELVNEGLCDKILIECRDEVYNDLRNHAGDISQGRQEVRSVWQSRETIVCQEINEDIAEEVVSWVYSHYDINSTAVGSEVLSTDSLVTKFGCNPEFLKIAARLSATGESVQDVETIGELIELDIRSLLSNIGAEKEAYRDFVELLALTRGISISRAMNIIGEPIRHADVVDMIEVLEGYVNIPEDDPQHSPATLSPDIYSDLLFQHWHIEENSPERLSANARDLLNEGYEDLLADVFLNLSLAYNRADERPEHREKIQTAASESLTHLKQLGSDDTYLQAISNLGSIPVRSETLSWEKIDATLTQSFMENMWENRVYSEFVIDSIGNQGYDETLDITTSIGRLLASQLRTYGSDEARETFSEIKDRFNDAEDSIRWSEDVMAHLPTDLLTYMLMESTRNTIQHANDSVVSSEVDKIFEFFVELNNNNIVHSEAAGQLFAAPFTYSEAPNSPGNHYDQLNEKFNTISSYLHTTAERSNLFEPKKSLDWSSASSVFLRRFHLEISLLTDIEKHTVEFGDWMTVVWESVEDTIDYCNNPSMSLFATVRTIIISTAIRQEMVLNDSSDIISTCVRTMVEVITPRTLDSADILLSQWFTDHPDSWYARVLELTFINIVAQEQNEAFGDDLTYRIGGKAEPDRNELVRIVEVLTDMVHYINQIVDDKSKFEREVCYAWYRGLVLSENPSVNNSYLQCVENHSNEILDYGEKKYLCLWTVISDEVQNAVGTNVDPYFELSYEQKMNKTVSELLSWLEIFFQEDDALLAAIKFSQRTYDDSDKEIEKLLTEVIGILTLGSDTREAEYDEYGEYIREIYNSSEPLLKNMKYVIENSDITEQLSQEMKIHLRIVNMI